MSMDNKDLPQLGIQTISMPEHKNNQGAIFGGWMLSQMDLAGAIISKTLLNEEQEVVTVKVDDLIFEKPVFSGDVIQCWVKIEKIGNTSITTHITVNAIRKGTGKLEQNVAHGNFIYVSVVNGIPSKIERK